MGPLTAEAARRISRRLGFVVQDDVTMAPAG
jgi:hypothetical protein